MTRDRPAHVAQATWRNGALHVWGWNGRDTASMAWFYSGIRSVDPDGRRAGWHDSPISYGALGRISIDVPEGPALQTSSVQLDAIGTAVWLSELPPPDHLSDSIRWFAAIADLARQTVSTGRMVPTIVDEGPFTVARWRPITDATIDAALDALDRSMPPVCTAGSAADAAQIHAALVDGIARSFLERVGWRPDVGRGRRPDDQALRATFQALSQSDRVLRRRSPEFDAALHQLRGELERHRRHVDGEPVVVPRLRLVVPSDPLDAWEVRIELADHADPARWCTANDAWDGGPLALDLARDARHLPILIETITGALPGVSTLPGLADLAVQHEPTGVELDLDTAEDFLDVAPHELRRLGIELVGPERLVRSRINLSGHATPAPADDRRTRFGREALVDWTVSIGDDTISDAELSRAEAAGATLLHTGHRWVRIDPDELRRKRSRLRELRDSHARVGAIELLQLANDDEATSEAALVEPADDLTRVDDWVRELLDGLPDERLPETLEPSTFQGELRHYQRRALTWMRTLTDLGLGGCLADDMGLGKTATTLAHLVDRPGPHLVVCPLSVVRNWRDEAARFTPKLDVQIHHGAKRTGVRRGRPGLALASTLDDTLFEAEPEHLLVITTYGLLPRDLTHLGAVTWSTVVLDEAQMVKNPNTKAARAVRALRAEQKWALTGTPVENRLSELWSILDAVNPGMLGSLSSFRERFGTRIERHDDADAAERLRRITRPFVLRRTKADRRLLPDLPDKIEQIAYATLTREQATLYQQVVDQLLEDAEKATGMRRRGLVLAALTRLKQICNHPAHALRDGSRLAGRSGKLARFDELVTELLDQGERALVFTQFREMGDLLQRHVGEQFALTSTPFLHGGVARSGRDRMVDRFQSDPSASPLLIVSLKAGGTGLNLTAASQVIHYDRWWNPAVEDQATDRAWRMGQHRTVNVHKLVCEGTVEERIGAVIDDKRRLADAVIGTSEASVSELSTDELRDLVVLDPGGEP